MIAYLLSGNRVKHVAVLGWLLSCYRFCWFSCICSLPESSHELDILLDIRLCAHRGMERECYTYNVAVEFSKLKLKYVNDNKKNPNLPPPSSSSRQAEIPPFCAI